MKLLERFRKLPDGNVALELTDGQHEPLGKIVGHLYYHNKNLLDLAPNHIGYPSNGGQHSLHIRGSMEDIKTFVELLIEEYGKFSNEAVKEGVDVLRLIRIMLTGRTGL
jgi:hypothetical protein